MWRVRRLLQHAVVAIGVSALAAGVVASGLNQTSATETAGVSSVSRAAAPMPVQPMAAPSADALRAGDTSRFERDTRSAARPRLSLESALLTRSKALDSQHAARVKQQKAIKKKRAAAAAAKKKAAAERKKRIRALGYEPGTTDPRDIARQIMNSKYGWGSSEFGCYNKLIMSESNWVVTAANPSGAYGIPQSLPGSKMASAGSDWRTNPATQIIWGLRYVKDVYGTPCGAWSFKQGHNWY